jgi:hypothetical protein
MDAEELNLVEGVNLGIFTIVAGSKMQKMTKCLDVPWSSIY